MKCLEKQWTTDAYEGVSDKVFALHRDLFLYKRSEKRKLSLGNRRHGSR